MDNRDPLISVIIPVYNVEPYLPQCLDSVLNSTYSNLQVILVDDGSPDNCGSICDSYAETDQRITVIHQKNQGLSEARNSGLAIARGAFVTFIDSDDIVSPSLFDTLLWAIKHTDSDIAACEYTRTEKAMVYSSPLSPEQLKVVYGTDGCLRVFSNEPSIRAITWTGPMVWNKLYRKQKIKTTFKKGCVPAEDMQFNWEYSENCNKMVIVPQVFYYWRSNSNSITQSLNVSKYVTIAYVWMDIAQKTHGADETLRAHLRYRAASSAYTALWRIFRGDLQAQYSEFCNPARSVIRQYFPEMIAHQDAKFYEKVAYFLCRYCYSVWKLLPKTYEWLKRVFKR